MEQQKTIPFVTQYTEPARVLQYEGQQLMHSAAELNRTMLATGNHLGHQIQTVEKKLQSIERKKRRSCVSENLALLDNGKIVVLQNFDDGTQEVRAFSYNLTGRWTIARIEFQKIESKDEKYIIQFPAVNLWVIGDVKKNNGKNLYEAFIRAGVIFASDNSVSKIQRLLFMNFGAEIDRTQSKYCFPELAGWNSGRFLFAENCNYEKRLAFPELPVMKKHFSFLRGNMVHVEKYLNMFRKITHWQERLILLEMPIFGLLASIFAEEGRKINFALNLVCCDSTPPNDLIYALQIFNRNRLFSIDAGVGSDYIREILKEANDEVVIVDATGEGSGYLKKKRYDNVQNIARKICHEGNSVFEISRDINASLIIFNSSWLLQEDVINLMISSNVFRFKESRTNEVNHVVPIFFTEFILFAERKIEEIRSIIRNSERDREGILLSGWKILHIFCCEQGIDLSSAGGFPEKIDVETLLEKFYIPDDLADIVKRNIRKEMQYWVVIEKRKLQEYVFPACYYDNEHIWIPTRIFDRMLAQEGLLPYKLNFLYEMKKKGDLQTDPAGLSSRVQIGGNRIEAYKFRRACFSVVGEADIVDLGKEIISHVDG